MGVRTANSEEVSSASTSLDRSETLAFRDEVVSRPSTVGKNKSRDFSENAKNRDPRPPPSLFNTTKCAHHVVS